MYAYYSVRNKYFSYLSLYVWIWKKNNAENVK